MKELYTKSAIFIFFNLLFSFIIARFIYYTMKESNRIELVKNYIDNFKLMGYTFTLILLAGLFSVYFNFQSLIFNIMLFGSIYMFNSAVKNVFLELQTSQGDYY